jgi:hypothetical protein
MDICGQFVNHDGSLGIVATLTYVGFSTRHNFNVLSVTSLWQQGWSTQCGISKGLIIIGPDGGSVINIDIVVGTTRGAVYVGRFVRLLARTDGVEISVANPSTKPRMMSILVAHRMLGHKSEDSTWQTAKALGITIMRGSMPVCKACALSKAKQKNVPKKSTVTRPFQRVHTDISQIKVLDEDQNEVTLSKTLWIIHVDAFTGKKVSAFTTTKNALVRTLWSG